ncbi:hypothetical protein ACJX0J_012996, partial [Zea mays]
VLDQGSSEDDEHKDCDVQYALIGVNFMTLILKTIWRKKVEKVEQKVDTISCIILKKTEFTLVQRFLCLIWMVKNISEISISYKQTIVSKLERSMYVFIGHKD